MLSLAVKIIQEGFLASNLDNRAQNLLNLLVSKLQLAIPNNPRSYQTYKAVHNALGLALIGPTYGESLKRQGLAALAEWTKQEGLPAITGLIIAEDTLEPGQGFFSLFGKTEPDYEW